MNENFLNFYPIFKMQFQAKIKKNFLLEIFAKNFFRTFYKSRCNITITPIEKILLFILEMIEKFCKNFCEHFH